MCSPDCGNTRGTPAKTVARAEGTFEFGGHDFRLVDLPGTYSLLATSVDEEVGAGLMAIFCRPDVTVIVVDANGDWSGT